MTTHQSELTKTRLPSYDLTGKRVVVVGGKTGIGLGIAQAAHAAGASVTVASRRSAPSADHPDLAPFKQIRLDIGDEEAVRAAFDAIGFLDHLVVAAGPTDGSWGTFMDDDMRGVRSYLNDNSSAPGPAPGMPARCFPRTGPSPSSRAGSRRARRSV